MSELHLITTIGEIKQRLSAKTDSFNILKIINYSPPSDWSLRISFNNQNKISLKIRRDKGAEYHYFNGIFPEIFRAKKIHYIDNGKKLYLDLEEALSAPDSTTIISPKVDENHDLGDYQFELEDIFNNKLPPAFNNESDIKQYLEENTWLGSENYSKRKYSINVEVLSQHFTFPTSSYIENKKSTVAQKKEMPYFKKVSSLAGGTLGDVTYFAAYDENSIDLRSTQFGKIPNEIMNEKFNFSLKELSPGIYEIKSKNILMGTDGKIMVTQESIILLKAFFEVANQIRDCDEYISYLDSCVEYRKKLAASRIDERKKKLLNSKFVYFRDCFVYKKPSNEMETIALHQKLEGMGGVPFSKFTSLEYTAKVDIDSIANYKIMQIDQLHKFATVEYEFVLSNFFEHKHPIEQTDIVICWEVDIDEITDGELRLTDKAWLYYLYIGNHKIVVAEIINYPNITLSGLTS